MQLSALTVANTNSVGTQIPLNRFGSVTETGITCANFTLDYQTSEYVNNMTVFYTSKAITRIILTSNTGKTLSRGFGVIL